MVQIECNEKTWKNTIRAINYVLQDIFVTNIVSVVENMAQDTTAPIKGSWTFLNTTHLYKNTLDTVLLLMLPHFGRICLMMFVLPQLNIQEQRLMLISILSDWDFAVIEWVCRGQVIRGLS